MPKRKEKIIFDANFFICMLQIRARNILGNLNKAAEDLGYDYYISRVVLKEIKAPPTFIEKLQKIVNVIEVLPHEIDIYDLSLYQGSSGMFNQNYKEIHAIMFVYFCKTNISHNLLST